MVASLDDLLNGLAATAKDGLNRAVLAISYPTSKLESSGRVLSPGAVSHALDTSADDGVHGARR